MCEAEAENGRGDCLADADRRNNEWRDMCIEIWLDGGFDPANPPFNDLGRDNCLADGRRVYRQDMEKCEKQYDDDMANCEKQYEQDMADCQKAYEECKKALQKTCLLGVGASACSVIGGVWIAGVAGGAGTCRITLLVVVHERPPFAKMRLPCTARPERFMGTGGTDCDSSASVL
jgi:hypothetical protein